jgi:hypothetical protein
LANKRKKEIEIMTKEKTPNYSAAQEAIIATVALEKGGVLTFADCEDIASRVDMRDNEGNFRKPRSIVAKITRMPHVAYKAKERVTKSGAAIERKDEIVAQIANKAGVAVSALEGMQKSPKEALVTLRNALAS